MMTSRVDSALESRLEAALQEMMPYLETCGREVGHQPAVVSLDIDPTWEPPARVSVNVGVARPVRSARQHAALRIAAGALLVAGLGAVVVSNSGQEPRAVLSTAGSVPESVTFNRSVDTTVGSLLTTAVPSTVQPLISIGQPGWTVENFTGFQSTDAEPTADCAGCGATRLIVAADGPLFGGPIFTAWTLEDSYDVAEFDWPVTIGSATGRFIGSVDGAVNAAQNRVRVVWPVGPGRTAFVDAAGFTNQQVFEMAATLTFESTVPTMAAPPAGFSVKSADRDAGPSQQMVLQFVNGDENIEVIASSAGLLGLLDWKSVAPNPMSAWVPRDISGVTVAFDHSDANPSPRLLGLSASWVAGGLGYMVIGNVFSSEAEFLDVVASLQLTDSATFGVATANVTSSDPIVVTPSLDGTTRTMG